MTQGNSPSPSGATAGSGPALDVFALRDSVVGEYKRFATSFTTIHAPDIREQVEGIYAGDRYWPEPLIQINPSYKRSTDVGALVAGGVLDPGCADIFRAKGEPLSLYKHQQQAIALANSQMDELAKFVDQVPGAPPITFDRYTGQDDQGERRRIAREPPDILLTNFMMLELLMTRQEALDRQVIGNCAGLRFLVLDELHTYRGRQGADVALLVRRVRERLQPETTTRSRTMS